MTGITDKERMSVEEKRRSTGEALVARRESSAMLYVPMSISKNIKCLILKPLNC